MTECATFMLLCKYVGLAPRLVNNLSLTTKTSLITTIALIDITVITVTNRGRHESQRN